MSDEKQIIVYQTNDEGIFIGTTVADESPLEKGVFLIPRGAVKKAPPKLKEKQRARWDVEAQKWAVEEIPPPDLSPGLIPVWEDGAWRAVEVLRLPEVEGLEQVWANNTWAYRRLPKVEIPPAPETTDDQIALFVDGKWVVHDIAPAEQ